ncbi:MAG: DUF4038 domain-containing protein, partial [Actinobacteria bacterium]|nr:DUF4038 domain-containing protein [Actinomycetota bacterium]
MTINNPEVSQYVLPANAQKSDDHSAITCVRKGSGESVEVTSFISKDGRLRCRVPGDKSEWASIKNHNGEDLDFEKSWKFSQVGITGKSNSSILHDDNDNAFLWLADTVWFGLTDRISNSEWKTLMEKRTKQGFNVMQVVSGLLPEAAFGEPSTLLDGVASWTLDKKELEKRWWDAADLRVIDAVQAGQMPALVGAWSYYILEFGAERLKKHWSEMIARWSAFPVFWCVAGEVGLMEYKDLFTDDMQEKA